MALSASYTAECLADTKRILAMKQPVPELCTRWLCLSLRALTGRVGPGRGLVRATEHPN